MCTRKMTAQSFTTSPWTDSEVSHPALGEACQWGKNHSKKTAIVTGHDGDLLKILKTLRAVLNCRHRSELHLRRRRASTSEEKWPITRMVSSTNASKENLEAIAATTFVLTWSVPETSRHALHWRRKVEHFYEKVMMKFSSLGAPCVSCMRGRAPLSSTSSLIFQTPEWSATDYARVGWSQDFRLGPWYGMYACSGEVRSSDCQARTSRPSNFYWTIAGHPSAKWECKYGRRMLYCTSNDRTHPTYSREKQTSLTYWLKCLQLWPVRWCQVQTLRAFRMASLSRLNGGVTGRPLS